MGEHKPEDGAIACAGVIQQAVKRKIPTRVVFVQVALWDLKGAVNANFFRTWSTTRIGPSRGMRTANSR